MYCIRRYRSQDSNLRTDLERIIDRAGVPRWERLWHNLRASAETDLVGSFPLHTAAQWLGHSGLVAARHYLTVRESDFAEALRFGEADRWGRGCRNPTESKETERQNKLMNLEKSRPMLVFSRFMNMRRYA